MTPEILTAVASIVLSLLFSYVPGLNTWYAQLAKEFKQLAMLGLLVVTGVTFGLACAGVLYDLFGMAVTCDQAGALGLVRALIFAIVANQGVYKLSPQVQAVREIKALQAGQGEIFAGRG
ncbi:MAG: hypothetical protein JRI77_08680 [Deltaproteobacteria bacterium]|nr:hypothetical protein [Deltaproteobacteria bacterium]